MPTTKSFYKIGEVSAIIGIPVSTLRFWEDTFEQLAPMRTPGGTRKYRPEDVETCKLIKHLLREKGLPIEYSRQILRERRKYAPRRPYVCKSAVDAQRLLAEAKNYCVDLHATARIEAVEEWLRTKSD